MHDKMMKMMMNKKKHGKTLSDSEKKSKLEALMGMKGLADSHMGNKLKNLKKVTVASNSPEGLKEGLHKAEELTDKSDDEMEHFSEGGSVNERGDQGGHVAKMPEEFDTDLDNAKKEDSEMQMKMGHDAIQHGYDEGTSDVEESPEHESSESPEFEAGENEEKIEQMVEESPNDPSELDALIQKLQEKRDSLQ